MWNSSMICEVLIDVWVMHVNTLHNQLFLIFLNNNVFMNLFYLLSYVHKNCRHDMPCNIIRIMFNLFFTHC